METTKGIAKSVKIHKQIFNILTRHYCLAIFHCHIFMDILAFRNSYQFSVFFLHGVL